MSGRKTGMFKLYSPFAGMQILRPSWRQHIFIRNVAWEPEGHSRLVSFRGYNLGAHGVV